MSTEPTSAIVRNYRNRLLNLEDFRTQCHNTMTTTRIEEICDSLLNVKKTRYVVEDVQQIDECFGPLMSQRDTIDLSAKEVRNQSRSRGFLLMLGQGGILGAAYSAFLRASGNDKQRLNIVLCGFIALVSLTGAFIIWQLHKLITEDFEKVEENRISIILSAEQSVIPFAVNVNKCETEEEIEETLGKLRFMNTEKMVMREDLVLRRLAMITNPINRGSWGGKIVYLEMAVVILITIGLAIGARFFVGPAPAAAPNP